MGSHLEPAVQELVELYTEKTFLAYQSGKIQDAAAYAERVLSYDPTNVKALFIRGAAIGRSSKPDHLSIKEAFDVWIPLVEQVSPKDRPALMQAIRSAFSTMTQIPLNLAFRLWSSYHSLETLTLLHHVLTELASLEVTLPRTREQQAWIAPLCRENYFKWVFDVIGSDLPIPRKASPEILDTFYEILKLLYEMIQKVPVSQPGSALLLKRTKATLDTFERLHVSP